MSNERAADEWGQARRYMFRGRGVEPHNHQCPDCGKHRFCPEETCSVGGEYRWLCPFCRAVRAYAERAEREGQ